MDLDTFVCFDNWKPRPRLWKLTSSWNSNHTSACRWSSFRTTYTWWHMTVCLVWPQNNTATFNLHIRNIVKKARDKMECVLRVFQSRKRSLMLTLLKFLVISRLEYCCQLWNPWKAKDIQAIEAIQRTFTYKITEVQHLNYGDRLHELKWYSLQKRRERHIIVYI